MTADANGHEWVWHSFTFEGRELEWTTHTGSIGDRDGEREVENVILRRAGCRSGLLGHHQPAGTRVDETHAVAAAKLFFEGWERDWVAKVEAELHTCRDRDHHARLMAMLTYLRVIASWRPLVDFDATSKRAVRLLAALWWRSPEGARDSGDVWTREQDYASGACEV
jgi:hypothetical protein